MRLWPQELRLRLVSSFVVLLLLTALNALCADWTDGNMGILQKCTASYHNDGAGRHVNILYGDYFFIEALCKLRGTDARLWMAGK